jgi:uncharacterized NAD(P)/FAD-binding protein YdhS
MSEFPYRNIAIVGTGPTALYTLHHLLEAKERLMITLFEAGPLAGVGLPYAPQSAQLAMLANIASIEIPPLSQSYLDWLKGQSEVLLRLHGVEKPDLHDRQFLPRLLLGGWFRDELETALARAAALGHRVALRERCRVVDLQPAGPDLRLSFESSGGIESLLFTHVVLATGHDWQTEAETDHFYPSPWSGLLRAEVPASEVGILGTSLSAIDAAMAVACQHGGFDAEERAFTLSPGSEGLKITLMSRQGLLPEADFWCPLPYLPLAHLTEAAMAEAKGQPDLLDRLWALFKAELTAADPAYAAEIQLQDLDPEGFAASYFAPRLACDPFLWAKRNLDEVERNAGARRTVEWRYAILRMHEPFETMVPALSPADLRRFEALKRVFIDNYAAVPPRSIRRLLALRAAGVLEILALGEDYDLTQRPDCTELRPEGGALHLFETFIDARGQRALEAQDLPFPSLAQALPPGPVPLDENFSLKGDLEGRVFLPAAPYLLRHRPFSQGITASAEMGARVAGALTARPMGQRARRA